MFRGKPSSVLFACIINLAPILAPLFPLATIHIRTNTHLWIERPSTK
jgi:hypothetical protein